MRDITIGLLLLIGVNIQGQTNIDSLLEALPVAKDTLRLQAINKILVEVRSTDKELAQRLINEEYELASVIGIDKFTAEVHNANGIFKYFQNELDSAIFYFEKALKIYERNGNIARAAYLINNIGIMYQDKGDFDTAIQYYLASLKTKEEKGDKKGIANSKFSIANVWIELGDYEKAKELYLESNEIYKSLGLEKEIIDVVFSLAAVASNQDSNQLAIDYYAIALDYYKKTDSQYDVLDCYNNIGQAHYDLNNLDSALYYYHQAMPMAERFEDEGQIASLNRHIGDVYSAQGRHREAVSLLKKSVNIYKALGFKDQLSDSYQFLYMAQENAGQYEAAYYNFQNYVVLRDSIASIQMQTDIVELETKYESEKKEKELVISRAENDRKQARIRLLSTGLASLFLLCAALYYAMRQKVNRTKVEKAKVAMELRDAEQQLEYKKKELTAKALQLARKNEFLTGLESEIDELKSSVDTSVGKTSARISRMIQMDANDDQDWEQFGKEFSSIHQDFLDRLQSQHGKFSKNELRLIALMKMNLSSKDIANTLRISDDGIKKARYRLRKKLELESDVDIQNYLIAF